MVLMARSSDPIYCAYILLPLDYRIFGPASCRWHALAPAGKYRQSLTDADQLDGCHSDALRNALLNAVGSHLEAYWPPVLLAILLPLCRGLFSGQTVPLLALFLPPAR